MTCLSDQIMHNTQFIREIEYNGEIFKDIPGYYGYYAVSKSGNVLRRERIEWHKKEKYCSLVTEKLLVQSMTKRKRGGKSDPTVSLRKDGTYKRFYVSRLVAMTWCKGYKPGLTVNHIDGNPQNNCAENLEWVTLEENIRHAFRTGLNQRKIQVERPE